MLPALKCVFDLCRMIFLCLWYKTTSMVRLESFSLSTTLTHTCFTSLARCVSGSVSIHSYTNYLHTFSYKAFACLCQGDGSIRYYEISSEKPYIHYLTDYRSVLPQKGMGKKHTLLRNACLTSIKYVIQSIWIGVKCSGWSLCTNSFFLLAVLPVLHL